MTAEGGGRCCVSSDEASGWVGVVGRLCGCGLCNYLPTKLGELLSLVSTGIFPSIDGRFVMWEFDKVV